MHARTNTNVAQCIHTHFNSSPAPSPSPVSHPLCPRPDYKELRAFKNMFPDVPLMALTATATPRVQHDVREQLLIKRCIMFKSSFNRPNLWWVQLGRRGRA